MNHCMEPRVLYPRMPGRNGFVALTDEERRQHYSLLAKNYPVRIWTFSGLFYWSHLGLDCWADTLKQAMEEAIGQREKLFHASYRVPGKTTAAEGGCATRGD